MNLSLDIQNTLHTSSVPSEPDIIQWISSAFENGPEEVEICLRLVDETESAALNQQYRKKAGPTNILSFPATLPEALAKTYLLGDLVICMPLLEREALEANISVRSHFAHLIIHGCLHLQGYDHMKDDEAEIMENLETRLMQSLGFANPYSV